MKQVIKEYLAALSERDELDVIVPELLSNLGFHVYSRPSRGISQFGVDVAAVGADEKGDKCLYLVTIKRGHLTRTDWDSGNEQDVRRSLNEIRESYLRRQVPKQLKHLNVVIAICCGGEIRESVRGFLTDYTHEHSTSRLSFVEWDGDFLAGRIEDGVLREGILTGRMRTLLREALSTCEDADKSFDQFADLIRSFVSQGKVGGDDDRIDSARRTCICTWMLFCAGRSAGNLESAYLGSEYALLMLWSMGCAMLKGYDKQSRLMGGLLFELTELHFKIWDNFIGKKVIPHASKKNAVSAAVRSPSYLDVNLKLFDMLGRIALHGLWLVWIEGLDSMVPNRSRSIKTSRTHELAQQICGLVAANTVLMSPMCDEQVIDLTLAFMFMAAHGGCFTHLRDWLRELSARYQHAYILHRHYPCIYTDYADLLEHPKRDNDYREKATAASTLFPTLVYWTAALGDVEALGFLAEFRKKSFSHSTLQLWLPDEDTEAHLYSNDDPHGAAYTDIPIAADPAVVVDYVRKECGEDTPFFALSAIEQRYWPIVLLACRHHRLPIPPHFWSGLLDFQSAASENKEQRRAQIKRRVLRRPELLATTPISL